MLYFIHAVTAGVSATTGSGANETTSISYADQGAPLRGTAPKIGASW
jgi:hypothetical protein